MSPIIIKVIRKLRELGNSYGDISEIVGVSKSSVRRYAADVSISDELRSDIQKRGKMRAASARSRTTGTHKFCPACDKDLPHASFYTRSDGHLMGYCKNCQSDYATKRNKRRYQELRALIDELKDVPCKDCKKRFAPFAMDFDHKNADDKLFNISEAVNMGFSNKRVIDEASKCDVVCAVCHRYRTFSLGRPGRT